MTTTPRAPTPADTIKALRDALTYAVKQVPELGTVPGIAQALALTADASEDAPNDPGVEDDAYKAMRRAHAFCPTGLGHIARMRWMADYFLKNYPAARPAPVGAGMAPEVMRALSDVCDLAMNQSVQARIPECGDFGAIAQNLSWVIQELGDTATTPLCPARKVECGQNLQQWCATCPEWGRARSAPMAAEQAKPEAVEEAGAVDRFEAIGAARWRYMEDHACTVGGGDGFTITCHIPFDCEDMGCGVDMAIAASATHKGEENADHPRA